MLVTVADDGKGIADVQYLGTAFFLRLAGQVVVVTALHVVPDSLKDNQRFGVTHLPSNRWFTWSGFGVHPTADLAFAGFTPEGAPPFVEPLHLVTDPLVLPTGHLVGSFGFPFTGTQREPSGATRVSVEEIFFWGYVATHYARETLRPVMERPFATNYALSFQVPCGLSGAPLLVELPDKQIGVCGMVYGNRSTEFTLDQYTESIGSNGPKIEHRVVELHHFGLASTAAELAQIPSLLRDGA